MSSYLGSYSSSIAFLRVRFQRIVMSFLAPENLPMSAVHKKLLPEIFAVLDTLFDMAVAYASESTFQQCAEWWKKLCMECKLGKQNVCRT